MATLLEKITQRSENEQKRSNGYVKTSSTKMRWKDGKNVIRFVGNYVEVHTHNISPNNFGSIGVAEEAYFKIKGDGRLPFEVACTDWDLKNEKYHKEHTCPFCKLYKRAVEGLKRKDLTNEEKVVFENIKNACKPTKKLKWNTIDRESPFYLRVQNGKEEQVRGLKYSDLSFSMFNDVKGIVEQNNIDISDPDTGIDMIVTKGSDNGKTEYSIQPCLEKMAVKITPLTDEEKSWKQWDFVELYDKPYDFPAIKGKMHNEFRIVFEMSDEEFSSTLSSVDESGTAEDLPPDDTEDSKKNSEDNLPF